MHLSAGPEIIFALFTIAMYTMMAFIPITIVLLVLNLIVKPVRRLTRNIRSMRY